MVSGSCLVWPVRSVCDQRQAAGPKDGVLWQCWWLSLNVFSGCVKCSLSCVFFSTTPTCSRKCSRTAGLSFKNTLPQIMCWHRCIFYFKPHVFPPSSIDKNLTFLSFLHKPWGTWMTKGASSCAAFTVFLINTRSCFCASKTPLHCVQPLAPAPVLIRH